MPHSSVQSSSSRLLLRIIFLFIMGLSNSKSFPLTKKSTPRDVLNYLGKEDKFAPYVQRGGTAIVTGGNSGIGAVTVEYLATAGMNVVLCTRNVAATERDVLAQWPADIQKRIRVQHLDLADLDAVRQTAQEILKHNDSIDCLVNNAGIMALPERKETPQGVEMQFGTNHVGHYFLTRLLLPRLNPQEGRVVCVSSTAHTLAPSSKSSASEYDWESKQKYSAWGAYGRSKLANLLMAKSLTNEVFPQQSSSEKSITSVSLHPGVIQSPLWKHTGWIGSIFGIFFADKNVEQGAATNVYCALVDQVTPGAWYKDCQPAATSTMGEEKDFRTGLWEYTEKLLIEKGYGKDLPSLETLSDVALQQ